MSLSVTHSKHINVNREQESVQIWKIKRKCWDDKKNLRTGGIQTSRL